MIKHFVDQCHVSKSNIAVIKYVVSKMKNGFTTFQTLKKADRRSLMRDCIKYHQENKDIYISVMTGRF